MPGAAFGLPLHSLRFQKLKYFVFLKASLAYTISRQYNKYIKAVSRNEKSSTFESG